RPKPCPIGARIRNIPIAYTSGLQSGPGGNPALTPGPAGVFGRPSTAPRSHRAAFSGRWSALIAEGPGMLLRTLLRPLYSAVNLPRPQPTRASDSRIVALGTAHIEIVRAAYAPSRKLQYVADMPLKTESHVIFSADLQRFAGALFEAAGVASAMADEW